MKKRKLVTTFMLGVTALCCAFGFAACKDKDGGKESAFSESVGSEIGNSSDEESNSAVVEKKPSEGLEFDVYENDEGDVMCEVIGIGTCTDTEILIPSTYNGESVTDIGAEAFKDRTSLTSVIIPDSVEEIGNSAFEGCSGLTSITIPDNVTSIGDSAFSGCDKLPYNEYDNGYYLGNETNPYRFLIKVKSTDITSCKIHENTKIICKSAFAGCGSLTSIAIPDSVTKIGNFSDCSSLTSVTIGNGVTSIGGAFNGCSSLKNVTIGNGVTSIGAYAFLNCSSLTSVTIGNGVTVIGSSAFSGCTGLTSITIPDSVSKIEYSAFRGCSSLTNITIPDSVTSVGVDTFYGCAGLTSVTIGNGVTKIGQFAFGDCRSLTSITLSNSVTEIEYAAFMGCDSLTSIIFKGTADEWKAIKNNPLALYPFDSVEIIYKGATEGLVYTLNDTKDGYIITDYDGTETDVVITAVHESLPVVAIGQYAFEDRTDLTSIMIPDSVTSVGVDAFSGCDNLEYNEYDNAYYLGNETNPYVVLIKAKSTEITSCEIHNDAKIVYNAAFENCMGLTGIEIPDGVTWIGEFAFSACTGLTSIEIPANVAMIEEWTFSACTGLTSVTIGGNVTSIGEYAFFMCNSLTEVTIPDSVTTIGDYAFYGCGALKSVAIGKGVTSIEGYGVFTDCVSLTGITVDENNTAYKSVDGNLYTKDGKALVQYAIGKTATSFAIPEGVTAIGSSAFLGSGNLTSVTIPASVTELGFNVFYGCSALTNITVSDGNTEFKSIDGNLYTKDGKTLVQYAIGKTATEFEIPEDVEIIAYGAFAECTALTSVTISASVTSICGSAFLDCVNLTSITFEGTVAEWNAIEKDIVWNYGAAATEVVCSDGKVALESYEY